VVVAVLVLLEVHLVVVMVAQVAQVQTFQLG
jgi:hypothetical protein